MAKLFESEASKLDHESADQKVPLFLAINVAIIDRNLN